MSTRIIAIDVTPKKKNLICETIEIARRSFVSQPGFSKTMAYSVLQRAIEKGDVVYDRDTKNPYCLDLLLEPEYEDVTGAEYAGD